MIGNELCYSKCLYLTKENRCIVYAVYTRSGDRLLSPQATVGGSPDDDGDMIDRGVAIENLLVHPGQAKHEISFELNP